MSDIEALIKEFCPDGVEFKTLGDVTKRPKFKQVAKAKIEKLVRPGCQNKVRLLPSSNDEDWWSDEATCKGIVCEGEVITLGRARYANLKCHQGKFVSSNNNIIQNAEDVLFRFLYHFIKQNCASFYVVSSTYPKFDDTIFRSFQIPVPPLEVQKEIVRVLDTFTKLESEIKTEIEAVRKQYVYYRAIRLNIDSDVEHTRLDDLIRTKKLSVVTPSVKIKKSNYAKEGKTPIISQESEFISGYCDSYDPRISPGEYICFGDHTENFKFVNFPFVQGADGLKIIKSSSDEISLKYIYYALLNGYIKQGIYQRHFSRLRETKIPIPSLGIQTKIAQSLDKFSTLIASASSGLPAEIRLRRRQYEYCLNKILTLLSSA